MLRKVSSLLAFLALTFAGLVAMPQTASATTTDANLSALALYTNTGNGWYRTEGTRIGPGFSPDQTYYEAFSAFQDVDFYAIAADAGATVVINGGDASNETMTPNVPSTIHFPANPNNLVTIKVTAADGVTNKTYKINMSNVIMPQPELISFAPNKFSTGGGDTGVAYVKHFMNYNGCWTNFDAHYSYVNSNGDTVWDDSGIYEDSGAPDAEGITRVYLQNWGAYWRFRDTTAVSDLRIRGNCQVSDPLTGGWRTYSAENLIPKAITYFNPSVTNVEMPDTVSQHTIFKVSGPGMNSDGYFTTYLLNPATGSRLWVERRSIDSNSFLGWFYGWDGSEEWRSAKKLKFVIEQYDDEEVKPSVILYSKDVNFVPETPTQVAFSPAKGPVAGGNVVKVTGHRLCNWDREAWPIITIGGVEVSNLHQVVCDWNSQFSSSNGKQFDGLDKFYFTVPPGVSAGPAEITIDIGYGPSKISTKYMYGDKPTVTSVTPSTVANTGGSMVTLIGTNFGTSGTPTVTIDGQKSPFVIRVSATKVLAMVPASASTGSVELNIISSSGGGALDTPSSITLAAPSANPTIKSVVPATGGVSGGDVVTITGTGFSAVASGVTFGGVPAKVTAATATSLSVEVPTADLPGAVDVVVGTPTGTSTKANAFTYTATPGVTSVSPSSIATTTPTASAKVSITGVGFGASGTISVGGGKAVAYKATAGGTTISNIAIPLATAGTVAISITPTGAKVPFTTSVNVTGPVITYLGPNPHDGNFDFRDPITGSGGWIAATAGVTGGDQLRIEGSGFGTAGKVKVGTKLVTPTSYSDTAIVFAAPANTAGTYDVTVVPNAGVVTAKRLSALNVGPVLAAPVKITTVASTNANTRGESANTFDPSVDNSDLFTITGSGFNSTDSGASTKVTIQSDTGSDPVTLNPVTVTDTTLVFHAPRNFAVLHWSSVKVSTKTSYAYLERAIFYVGVAPQPTVMSPGWGLCTKEAIGSYNPASITATGDHVFGTSGTVSLDGTVLPAAAVNWSESAVSVDLSRQVSNLANPWGSKSINFIPADSSLPTQSWNFNCSVQSNVTTKLNGSTAALTLAAGTAYTAGAQLENALPGTTFAAADGGYYYQSAEDYAANARRQNVRSGLPVAAGDWYVWVNVGAGTWDRVKYNYLSNANDVHLTLTGTPVTFTPKLASGNGSTLVYKGQLGDGTAGSSNDINYTKTATNDAVTEVSWQYRNHQCAVHDPNSGWSGGLPSNVAISPSYCGGDDTTVTTWDIRVAGFKMVSGGVDKSIYYLPTYNTFNLSITKKSVTITAVKAEKVYDGTTAVTLGEITVTGGVAGDVPTLDPTFAAGAAFASADAGAGKSITLGGPFKLSNFWAGNYTLANSNLAVTGTIKKADAVVKLAASPTSAVMGNTSSIALTVTATDARGFAQIADANAPAPVLVNKSTSVCSLNGTTITPIKAGDCVIQATQVASTDYNAAISYRDDTTTVEEIIMKIYAAPKVISVVADDIQVAAGEPYSPSYSMTGLLDGDGFENVTFDYYQGTTRLNAAPTTIGTYKIVPSGGNLAAVDTAAYNSTFKYVAGKLVITAAPPVITASSPAHGPEAGGNTLVITGTGFGPVTSITIGDVTIRKPKFVVNGTGTSISLKMPKGTGAVNVVLNAGSAQVSTDYTYDAPPVITAPLSINLIMDLTAGVKFAGQKVTITGGGLKANSEYTLVMHSTPVVIYENVSDSNGNFKQVLVIPEKACLASGRHDLVLTGVTPDGKAATSTGYFTLSDQCIVGASAVKTTSKSWTLSGFLFDYNSPKLNDGGVKSLKALASVIKGAKTVTILGYTETDTKSEAVKKANIVLAQGRCDSVVAYLKTLGIKAVYKTVAKGGVDPVSLSDQSKNRRVVINATY